MKKTTKKKTYSLMEDAKDNLKLGMVNTVGISALGSIGAGVPQSAVARNTAIAGLNLTQVGQLGKTGLNIAKMLGKKTK